MKKSTTSTRLNIVNIGIVIFFSVVVYFASYYTPLHSDDFKFTTLGFSISKVLDLYFTWEGRILPNFLASLVRGLRNHVIISAINSLFFIGLIHFIAKCSFTKTKSLYIFPIIFFLYWCCSPQLSIINFWIIGASDYLWSNLFTVIFFYLITDLFLNPSFVSKTKLTLISLFAFFACSSGESMGLAVLFVMASFLFYELRSKIKIPRALKTSIVVGLVAMGIMLSSPGSRIRLQDHSFDAWRSMSIVEKIIDHFAHRIPNNFDIFYCGLIFINIVMLSYFSWLIRKLPLESPGDLEYLRKKQFAAASFFLAGLFTNVVMVAAPFFPKRTMNHGLILFLISISVVLGGLWNTKVDKISRYFKIVALLLLIWFSASYYLFLNAFYSIYKQVTVREQIIESNKQAGNLNVVEIPRFFSKRLLRKDDHISTFLDEAAAGEFYGVQKIVESEPTFDYSQLLEPTLKLSCKGREAVIKGFYNETDNPLGYGRKFVFETNQDISDLRDQNYQFHIRLLSNNKVVFDNFSPIKPYEIEHRYFYVTGGRGFSKSFDHFTVTIEEPKSGDVVADCMFKK